MLLSFWVLQHSTVFTHLAFSIKYINMPTFTFSASVALSINTLPSPEVHAVI